MRPPSLPVAPRPPTERRRLEPLTKVLGSVALVAAALAMAAFALFVFGLLKPFSVPTGGMAPAISPGDLVIMEGFTSRSRRPRRGDVVCFKTAGIPQLPPAQVYVKRVAGEPGEELKIAGGMLYINSTNVVLSNATGVITYLAPPQVFTTPLQTNLTVPQNCYFVLGDNTTNSFDSRFYGSIPRQNVLGRIVFCYWPPGRMGRVK